MNELIDRFQRHLEDVIDSPLYGTLTAAEVFGVLELVKLDLWMNAVQRRNEDE